MMPNIEAVKALMRPQLAAKCIYFAMFYTFVMAVLNAFGNGPGPDWTIIAGFIAQPIAWVTSRGIEKTTQISKQGGSA